MNKYYAKQTHQQPMSVQQEQDHALSRCEISQLLQHDDHILLGRGMCAFYLLIFIFIDLQSQEEVLMLEREKTVRQSDFPGLGVFLNNHVQNKRREKLY